MGIIIVGVGVLYGITLLLPTISSIPPPTIHTFSEPKPNLLQTTTTMNDLNGSSNGTSNKGAKTTKEGDIEKGEQATELKNRSGTRV